DFKAGRIGRAILAYRRARALAPSDPDVAANLAFARSYRVDKLPEPGGLGRTVAAAFHRMPQRAAAELAAVGFLLASLLSAGWLVRRAPALAIGAALVTPVALYGLVSQQAWAGEAAERPAVVVVPEVEALSGPGSEFKQILLVHDGTEVRIREARGAYLL